MSQEPQPKRCFIYNPHAGQKAGVKTSDLDAQQVRDILCRHGLEGELIATESEEEAVGVVRDAVRNHFDVVVGVGGDGTQGLIARELLGTDTALGIIPRGSVMNIGRMLGIPRDADEAVEVLQTGQVRSIDVGEVNGQIFFEVASVGINAPVFEAVQQFDAGQRRSILKAIWVAIRYRPARMTIRIDNGVIVSRALIVTIANGSYTGMGFTVAPQAIVDDGLFDVTIFRRFSRTGLLIHFGRIAFGRKSYTPKVSMFRSKTVEIQSASPLPSRADSHDLGTTPVKFTCLPGTLKVVCPLPTPAPSN